MIQIKFTAKRARPRRSLRVGPCSLADRFPEIRHAAINQPNPVTWGPGARLDESGDLCLNISAGEMKITETYLGARSGTTMGGWDSDAFFFASRFFQLVCRQ